MKLKGIELKGTYKVKFSDTYFEVCNDKGYEIYFENSGGYWDKKWIWWKRQSNLLWR